MLNIDDKANAKNMDKVRKVIYCHAWDLEIVVIVYLCRQFKLIDGHRLFKFLPENVLNLTGS